MRKTIHLSLLFVFLNLCDALLTYYLINTGMGKEFMPTANHFLSFGFIPFLSFKFIVPIIILTALLYFYKKRINILLYIVNGVFIVIVGWNFSLSIISMIL